MFTLVSDQDIDVGENLLELNLEELRDERSRQVQDDSLALVAVRFGDLDDRFDTVGEEVTFNVKVLGRVDDAGDLGLGQMVRGEHLGGSKGGAQVPVVTGDDDGASSSSGRRGLNLVGRVDTFGLVGLLEGLHQVVISDRSDVGNGSSWSDVLERSAYAREFPTDR